MTKTTSIILTVETDDNGEKTLSHAVTIKNADNFLDEDHKEQSVSEDINYLFNAIESEEISRRTFVNEG